LAVGAWAGCLVLTIAKSSTERQRTETHRGPSYILGTSSWQKTWAKQERRIRVQNQAGGRAKQGRQGLWRMAWFLAIKNSPERFMKESLTSGSMVVGVGLWIEDPTHSK
jgi:hypothetical protein